MTGIWKHYSFVILAAIFYSSTAIFTKLSYIGGMQPMPLITLRFFLAAWLMFFYLIWTNKITISEIPVGAVKLGIPGFIGYGAAVIGFLSALKYLSAPVAGILLFTYPIHVTILSALLFKEPFTIRRIFALLLTFSGILFVINIFNINELSLHPAGILYSLGAAFGYAFFNVYGQKNISKVSPMLLSFYPLVIGAVLLPLFSSPVFFLTTPHSFANLLFGLGLAIISTVLPMILYFKGMEKVKASAASIISCFEPIFTVILAAVILGDKITTMQVIGGILVLSGIFVLQTEGK